MRVNFKTGHYLLKRNRGVTHKVEMQLYSQAEMFRTDKEFAFHFQDSQIIFFAIDPAFEL